MNPLHTPIKIDFLLSIYCGSFRRNNFPQHTSPISETVLQGLIEDELVMTFGADYTLTNKGEQFVERLLNTPLEPPAQVVLYDAVHELALVVERIARAQRGGKWDDDEERGAGR